MLSQIKKIIIIILAIILIAIALIGCTNIDIDTTTPVHDSQEKCGYQYTYGCGFDIISGTTKCSYGYYHTCR